MTDIEDYKATSSYEVFMCRAFRTDDREKPGIDLSNMRNLIWAENGNDCVSHLKPFETQLIKVKSYLEKAFDKLISRRKAESKIHELVKLKNRIQPSKTSYELISIINEALELTQDLK